MENLQAQQQEVLEMLCEYIPRLIDGIFEAKIAFQEGNEQAAYELSTQIIDGYNWVIDAIVLTNSMHEEAICLGETEGIIAELLEAFDNKDILLICDVIEYALADQLGNWLQLLEVTRAKY